MGQIQFDNQEEVFKKITESVRRIRYGSIEIVVHDSKIVQIECGKKFVSINKVKPDDWN